MGIGQHLHSARVSANLSRKILGDLCGLHPKLIERYENNAVRNPAFFKVGALAEQLGLSMDELYGRIRASE